MSEPMNAEEREILEKFERGDLLSSPLRQERWKPRGRPPAIHSTRPDG